MSVDKLIFSFPWVLASYAIIVSYAYYIEYLRANTIDVLKSKTSPKIKVMLIVTFKSLIFMLVVFYCYFRALENTVF